MCCVTVVHSNIWFYMVMCGCVRSWMTVSGRAWSYIALHGGEWSHTVIHGCGDIQSHISVSTTWSRADRQGHEDATGSPAPGYNVTDDQKRNLAFRGVYLEPGLAINQEETPHPPERPRINLCLSEGG